MVAEIRYGVETIDHIAIPVRDLALNQAFYVETLGLKFKTTRRNPDGSPRQTYVLAGDNIIGLHLPGVSAGTAPSGAPRIGVSVSSQRFAQVENNLRLAKYPFEDPVEHAADAPLTRSIYFDDPDGNHLEFCLRRVEPRMECISHTVFETCNMKKALTFYSEVLGTGAPIRCGEETMMPTQNGQMIGLVEVGNYPSGVRNMAAAVTWPWTCTRKISTPWSLSSSAMAARAKATSAPTMA